MITCGIPDTGTSVSPESLHAPNQQTFRRQKQQAMSDSDRARILIADDEPLFLRTTGDLLRQAGFDCTCVADGQTAIRMLQQQKFDLLLSDLNMPGNLKLELLQSRLIASADIPVIVITGVPSLPTAIESIRLGIADYLLKPLKFEDLLISIRRTLASRERLRSVNAQRSQAAASVTRNSGTQLIGTCQRMMEIREIIDRVADSDANILITGETGTGKEVVARTIHDRSPRAGGRFQIIDCTAVPESLFESMLFGHAKGAFTGAVRDQSGLLKLSDGGTAFFDEVGELPPMLQSKLLRAVQEQTFTPVGEMTSVRIDTRFICATNRDLEQEVSIGRFRRDLFYRLGVIHLHLPPLRERDDDIILLAERFLEMLKPTGSPVNGFSPDALRALRNYHWPGNIRELRNVIERALTLAGSAQICSHDLPPSVCQAGSANVEHSFEMFSDADRGNAEIPSASASRDQALGQAERQYLLNLIRSSHGNVTEAARRASMSRQGMHKRLKKHGIQPSAFRDNPAAADPESDSHDSSGSLSENR